MDKLAVHNPSFSFLKNEPDIMNSFGILKESDWGNKEKAIKSLRDSFNKRLK